MGRSGSNDGALVLVMLQAYILCAAVAFHLVCMSRSMLQLTVYIKSAPGGQNASSVQTYRNARDEAMGMNTTASTLVFVEALNAPEILIQIEAVAAR